MKKIFKGTVKYLTIFFLGAVLTALLGLAGLSYYAIDQLTKASLPESKPDSKKTIKAALELPPDEKAKTNPNLRKLIDISFNYDREFATFEELRTKLAKTKVPSFCDRICDPIHIDSERLRTERTEYLAQYYAQEGSRALQDPLFLLKLEEMDFLSNLFPSSMREILRELKHADSLSQSESQKWVLAAKTQFAALQEIASFYSRKEQISQQADKIDLLRGLLRKCQQGADRKEIIRECEGTLRPVVKK